jgi:hypothetical protein
MLPLIQRLRTNPLSIFTGFSMDVFQLNTCFLEQLRSRLSNPAEIKFLITDHRRFQSDEFLQF